MSETAAQYAFGMKQLAERLLEGANSIAAEVAKFKAEGSTGLTLDQFDDEPVFDALRVIHGSFDNDAVAIMKAGIARGFGVTPPPPVIGISQEAFVAAQRILDPANPRDGLARIRAVDEVESGSGYFQDVRQDILDADGPGGFLDGQHLPKILFEAHVFYRNGGQAFATSHPNLSSKKWNRSLYVGGQAEYIRLNNAMKLNREAALKACSWGRYQILGENFKAAGYDSVEAFVEAMKANEENHLRAFISFLQKNGLVDEFRRISSSEADCTPFAVGYNGSGQNANNYDGKIAAAFARWKSKL